MFRSVYAHSFAGTSVHSVTFHCGFVVFEKKKRSVWVKTYSFGNKPLVQELQKHYPNEYKNILHMDDECFFYYKISAT